MTSLDAVSVAVAGIQTALASPEVSSQTKKKKTGFLSVHVSRWTFRGGKVSQLSAAESAALTHVAPWGRFSGRDGPHGAPSGLGWALPPEKARPGRSWIMDVGS